MILECPVIFGHSIAAGFLWNDLITLLTFLTLSSSGMNILSDLNNVEIIYSQFSRCVMLVDSITDIFLSTFFLLMITVTSDRPTYRQRNICTFGQTNRLICRGCCAPKISIKWQFFVSQTITLSYPQMCIGCTTAPIFKSSSVPSESMQPYLTLTFHLGYEIGYMKG